MSKAVPIAEELFEANAEAAPRVSVIVLGRKGDAGIRESGVHRSISDDELERLARRDRETMPAPPDSVDDAVTTKA